MPTWNQNLAIGVPMLDAQHQELFQRADRLLAAMKTGKPAEEVGRLFQFLEEYCSRHFSAEEQLMRDREYAGLGEHLAQHAEFVEQFQAIVGTFRVKGALASVTIDLQQLICGWLVRHIGAVDKKLAVALAVPVRTSTQGRGRMT